MPPPKSRRPKWRSRTSWRSHTARTTRWPAIFVLSTDRPAAATEAGSFRYDEAGHVGDEFVQDHPLAEEVADDLRLLPTYPDPPRSGEKVRPKMNSSVHSGWPNQPRRRPPASQTASPRARPRVSSFRGCRLSSFAPNVSMSDANGLPRAVTHLRNIRGETNHWI